MDTGCKKKSVFYVSLWENDPTSNLIYYLSKRFSNEFMVSFASLLSSSTKHDVNFVNYDPVQSQTDDRTGEVLGSYLESFSASLCCWSRAQLLYQIPTSST